MLRNSVHAILNRSYLTMLVPFDVDDYNHRMGMVVAMCDEKNDPIADRGCSMIVAAPIQLAKFALEIVAVADCDSYRQQL